MNGQNSNLELDFISALVKEPSEVSSLSFNVDWLSNGKYIEIYNTIAETGGQIDNFTILHQSILDKYPQTTIKQKDLIELKTHSVTSAYISDYSKMLHKNYLKNKLAVVSAKFKFSSTEETMQEMNELIAAINDIDTTESTGEIQESYEKFLHEMENGREQGVLTYVGIDSMLGSGLEGGMLVTIGARPGIGKTAFAINLALKAMERSDNNNVEIDFFTLEMTQQQMLRRFISRMTEINSYKMRVPNVLSQKEQGSIVASFMQLMDRNLRVYDDCFTLDKIIKTIKQRRSVATGQYAAFIDYLGLIKVNNQRLDRRLQIGEITRELKKLTNELNIPIILLAQLNRGVEGRQDKTPMLSDLRESGDVEQDSNVVGFLYQAEPDNEQRVNLGIKKNREGSLGDVQFNFYKDKMFFDEIY